MADAIYELHENFQPFVLCSETIIERAFKWREANKLEHVPLKYFFEAGDNHWGQMSDRVRERFGEPPIPGEKKDPPLQAADLIAYEVRTAFVDLAPDSRKLFHKFGEWFLLLGDIPGEFGELLDDRIRTELRLRGIRRRR